MTPLEAELGEGPVPAAVVMERALYHPRHGYYRRSEGPWGREGKDYYTALDAGPLLGETLAIRLEAVWEGLGRPAEFTVLEPGAGRGWLGRDLLQAARPGFAQALRYRHRDDSPAGRAQARQALAPWLPSGQAAFLGQGELLEPFTGAVVSLELFDALPAQPYRWTGAAWELEAYTAEGPVWLPAEPGEATHWLEGAGALEPGDGAPWCAALPALLGELAGALGAGIFIAIDYGHGTARLLEKGARLRRYRAHRTDDRWWEDLGECDLTADVDFTRLAALLAEAGLVTAPAARLEAWIRTHAPLGDWEAEWPSLEPGARLKRMENLMELTLPGRMGERFQVLEAIRR